MISFLQMDIEPGELLFQDDFPTGNIDDRWEITGGEWSARDGILTGCYRENGGGLIYSKQSFPGDILMEFTGRMVPPCDNDLNFSFRADGWDYEHKDASIGYIGGLNGWWTKQAGLEKYPGCRLQALCGFKAESGRKYRIQTGIVGSTCFLAVDGNLIVTLSDPEPIAAENCMRVGLGTYCSKIEFSHFQIYRACVHEAHREYIPNF